MHIQKYTPQLINLIKYAQKDKSLELEVRIKESINNSITSEMFYNTLKRIKGMNFIKFYQNSESLDISFKDLDYRVTIFGNDNIIQYCQTNDIKSVNKKYVLVIKKSPVKKVDINDYKLRFNLKREINVNPKTPEVIELFKKWNSLEKIFRYKNRKSFRTTDNLFQYDLTILKSSNKKIVDGENTFMKKKFIKPFMEKYVAVPRYVVDFESWFSKIDEEDEVEMIGRKQENYILSKNLQKSNVLKNNLEYEIELEYIGNKINYNNDHKNILMKIVQNLVIILQSIQKSYYIISESKKSEVIDEYKNIMKDYRFKGPMSVTLEKKHVIERNYEDYQNITNIRRGYSVTDKADGERNLLLVLKDGSMYLLNRKNVVKDLGAKCVELSNSILDCEYITKDKNDKNINLVMLFDIYFYNELDLRNRILQRSLDEIKANSIEESRYEILTKVSEIIHDKVIFNTNNTLKILKKRFYYGDDNVYDPRVLDEIHILEDELLRLDESDIVYKSKKQLLSDKKNDTKIFSEIEKVLSKEYIYKTDGLVFTPRNLKVGEDLYIKKKNTFDGRWFSCFKWKPPEENTIDFLVKIKKDPKNEQKDLVKYINQNDTIVAYKTLVLHVGYNPQIHTKYNSCRILNENLTFENKYLPVPFNPTEPYIKESHLAFIPIKSDNIYTLDDNNIITDNCIVECKYEKDKFFKWVPIRIRDNLKPNDFVTATNVWNSINNPVTLNIIKTGVIEDKDNVNVYYNKIMKRKSRQCNSMYDFHSLLKKTLITENLSGNKNLLDLSVGKGGDINHWVNAEANFVVGIDVNKDNLINTENGACNRIFNKIIELKDSKLGEKTLMVWADSSQDIINGSAGLDELHEYYLNIIYGNIDISDVNNGKLRSFYNLGNSSKKGFDMVSSQFSLHYFFKDSYSLNNFLNNVSSSLKKGGKFIGTCLDGGKIFESLKSESQIYNYSESNNLCWKITKKYNNTIFPNNDNCLGIKIDVYNESIGASFVEYLVNFNYLITMCEKYNLKLVKLESFEKMFEVLSKVDYGDIKSMNDELKRYSFMNNQFVFEKF